MNSNSTSAKQANKILQPILHVIEIIGLIIITLVTVLAAVQEVKAMIELHHVQVGDLLMMFIYLEIIAMVIVYLQSGKLPILMPLFIAIVGLARHLIISENVTELKIIAIAGAIVMITIAVMVLQYGESHFAKKEDNNLGEEPK
jgi:protein PsiE